MPGSADNQAQSAPVPVAIAMPAQPLQCSLRPLQQGITPIAAQSILASQLFPGLSGSSKQHDPLPAVSGTQLHQTSASNDGGSARESSVDQQHAAETELSSGLALHRSR